jgi:antitoxin VapB
MPRLLDDQLHFFHRLYILIYILEGGGAMSTATAKVFISGNSQAIRLPREFRLNTTEVFIYKSGDSLILTPRMTSWEGFVEGLSGFSNDFIVMGGLTADTPRKALA